LKVKEEKIGELFKILIENFLNLNKNFEIKGLFEKKDNPEKVHFYDCFLENLNLIESKIFIFVLKLNSTLLI
jgi:hypothetical protein